jgi:hypothetical protein
LGGYATLSKEIKFMSKAAITTMLALALSMGAATGGNAAAVSPTAAGMRAALAPIDTVQSAQYIDKRTYRGPVRAAPRAVPQRGFVGRPGGVVGRPVGVVGRPVGVVGRPVGVGRAGFYGRPAFVRSYRPFYRRPWFGTVVGGVALGTILTVAAVGTAPAYAPAPDLCWFWADPSMTSGYWDYCAPPY